MSSPTQMTLASPWLSTSVGLADQYLIELAKPPSKSAHTLRAYQRWLGDFVLWLSARSSGAFANSIDLKQVQHTDVRDYMAALDEQGCTKATSAQALSVIRGWFKFLISRGYVNKNVALLVGTPRVPMHLPHVPSLSKMLHCFELIQSGKFTWRSRDLAIFEMFYACGLLTGELISLNVEDLDLTTDHIWVKGKNPRSLPVGERVHDWIEAYLPERAELLASRGINGSAGQPLFIRANCRSPLGSYKEERMTTKSVCRIVKEIALQGELPKETDPQTLRNAFAVHMLDRGANPRVVQFELGNKTVASVSRLGKLSKAAFRITLDVTHPRANVKSSSPAPVQTTMLFIDQERP